MAVKIRGTGNAANPSITGDDDDTGLVYGTNQIDFSTGGTTRATINSDGDVLIGRTSTIDSSEVLGLKGPDGDACTIGLTSDGTTQAGIIGFNDDDANFRGRIQYNHNGDTMVFRTAATERVRIESDGNFKILDGNLVIGASGHGIDFSDNSHAGGMSSELLDSYEEGTWTPTTSIGAMHTMHGAHYTKIGRLVNCQCYVTMPTSSASTHVRIDNFPFTSLGSNHYGIGAAYCQWQGNDHFFFQMSPSATHGYPHVGLGNAVTHATASGGYYLMSVTYFTA